VRVVGTTAVAAFAVPPIGRLAASFVAPSAHPMSSPLLHRARASLTALALVACALSSCGARTGLLDPPVAPPPDAATCQTPPPTCVAPATDPCAAPLVTAALCDASTLSWRCPPGARLYARAAEPAVCRPFHDPAGGVRSLGGTLARVPTDDGRCLWIAEDVSLASGGSLRNVAFEVDPTAPFGTCPSRAVFAGGAARSVVSLEGNDPSVVVQVTGGYRWNGESRVTYRLFRSDPGAPFGLTELGTGLARWDRSSQRIIVPSPASLRFSTELDLGDASLVSGDYAYVWGCPGPPMFLTERCVVARLDASDRMELFVGGGRWIASTRGSDAVTVFDAGPWVSSVVALPAGMGLAHVFAVGFGSDLQAHRASAPEGPWSAATPIARCDLPAADTHSYCAGPVVHRDLADPTRPGEFPVTYGVGSTEPPPGAAPDSYWTRLQWVQLR